MFFAFLLCATPSFAQMFVGQEAQLHLSSTEDTFFSEEKTVYIQADISGQGLVFLSKVEHIITQNGPKLANLYLKNSQVKLKGALEITTSLVLENTSLETEDAGLLVAPEAIACLDTESSIDHNKGKHIAPQTWLLAFPNQWQLLSCAKLTETAYRLNQTMGKADFAEMENKTTSQYIKQEEPPPWLS